MYCEKELITLTDLFYSDREGRNTFYICVFHFQDRAETYKVLDLWFRKLHLQKIMPICHLTFQAASDKQFHLTSNLIDPSISYKENIHFQINRCLSDQEKLLFENKQYAQFKKLLVRSPMNINEEIKTRGKIIKNTF